MVFKKNIELIKQSFIISFAALAIIYIVFELNPLFKPYMKVINLGIQDILISRYSTNTTIDKDILLVAIDDKTLSDTTWLWRWQDFKRSYYATVIDNLKQNGALVVWIDVLFSEQSKDEKEDDILAQSIKNAGNVILGFSKDKQIFPIEKLKTQTLGYYEPIINSENGKVYSFLPINNKINPEWESFSFAILRKYANEITGRNISLTKDTTQYNQYKTIDKFWRDLFIPYASENNNDGIYINYTPVKYPIISFTDVYHNNGDYQKISVKDKIVLIGATATALHDEFNTPLWTRPGVELHANMLNTIFNKSFITKVTPWKEYLFLITLTLLLTIYILYVNSKLHQLFFAIMLLSIMTIFEWACFTLFNKLFNFPVELFFIIFWVTIGTTLYKYFHEEKWKRALKWALSQYLSEELVVNILDNFEEVKLDGKRMTITSFFSDIAWFTSISENMEPEELVRFLSIYLKEVSDIIMHDKWFINKYEGDAVMALWWAFGWEEKEQAILACRAALLQQKKIQELNEEFKKNHGFEISVRMGINKWVAVVGNIGSVGKKIEYTALGDSVNTASRFEGINKLYGTLICVGESVMEEAKEFFVFRKLDSIQVKGKEKPVFIYELIGELWKVTEDRLQLIKEFEKALELYVVGNIIDGKEIFKKLYEEFNDAASLTFLNRCGKLIEDGVPEGWQGVYRATEK